MHEIAALAHCSYVIDQAFCWDSSRGFFTECINHTLCLLVVSYHNTPFHPWKDCVVEGMVRYKKTHTHYSQVSTMLRNRLEQSTANVNNTDFISITQIHNISTSRHNPNP